MIKYRDMLMLSLLLLCGCSESSQPTDMPTLYPCTISVTQGGSPLADAYVELISPDVQKYRPSAPTDASGNAVMLTYGHPGVPAGTYTILVSKTIEDDIVYKTDEYGERVVASSNNYKTVEDRYSNPETTPHSIEITSKSARITIDVGKAVRNKMANSGSK